MKSIGRMPAVRTPEAPQSTRHCAPCDSAFPIERQGRLLPPGSISGLSFRSLAFRPTPSLSTLRSDRRRPPRKTRFVAAGYALPRSPFQTTRLHALARRNPHRTVREPLDSHGSCQPFTDHLAVVGRRPKIRLLPLSQLARFTERAGSSPSLPSHYKRFITTTG